jgi:hypothetical protein
VTATADAELDPRAAAAVAMIGRTGAEQVQIRYQDDEEPVVWIAVARWPGDRWETAAGLDATRAVLRLCENVIDGGECTHCHRPTGFEPDQIDTMPAAGAVCWYQWDPELETFRRGCEGDEPRRPNRAERRRRT